MRFREFKLLETLNTTISADHLDGLKDVIARRIRSLPDDQTTAKALKDIEDLLQHLGSGGRIGSIGKELADVKDSAVSQFVTLSIGVTSFVPMTDSLPSVLLTAADYALYRAKELGRNQTYQIG